MQDHSAENATSNVFYKHKILPSTFILVLIGNPHSDPVSQWAGRYSFYIVNLVSIFRDPCKIY